MIKFDVTNRITGAVQFTAEIDCAKDAPRSIKLGLAVKWAIKSGADFYGADFSGANLSRADLSRADLSGADLSGADLSGASLYGADLSRADLSRADLSRANLSRANLYGADLSGANLSGADLYGADLYGANLYGANLYGADLSGANLSGANLYGAKDAERAIAQTRILPEGALVGWKTCQDGIIVKLRIPEDSPRSNAFGRKCRAKFVDVLEVIGADEGRSSHDKGKTIYRTGERVEAPNWSDDWQEECAGGIHFFITKLEAEDYA